LLICSAGIGVLNAARKTMARMLGNNESAFESAGRQFWVVDAKVRDVTYWPRILIMNLLSVLARYCKTTVIDLENLMEASRISFAYCSSA
jgi:hypothetical protein